MEPEPLTFELDVAMDKTDGVHPFDDIEQSTKHSSNKGFGKIVVMVDEQIEQFAARHILKNEAFVVRGLKGFKEAN